MGPIASAKVGYKDGNYILNPTVSQIKESDLELVVAGTKEGVLMVESEAQELSEETMLGAVMFGFENFQPVIKLIEELKAEAGKDLGAPVFPPEFDELYKKLADGYTAEFEAAFKETDKLKRGDLLHALRKNSKRLWIRKTSLNSVMLKMRLKSCASCYAAKAF